VQCDSPRKNRDNGINTPEGGETESLLKEVNEKTNPEVKGKKKRVKRKQVSVVAFVVNGRWGGKEEKKDSQRGRYEGKKRGTPARCIPQVGGEGDI